MSENYLISIQLLFKFMTTHFMESMEKILLAFRWNMKGLVQRPLDLLFVDRKIVAKNGRRDFFPLPFWHSNGA